MAWFKSREPPKPHPAPPHPGTEHFLSLTLASTSLAPFLGLPSPPPSSQDSWHTLSPPEEGVHSGVRMVGWRLLRYRLRPEEGESSKEKFVCEEHKLRVRVKGGRDLEGTDWEPGLRRKQTRQQCRNCSQGPPPLRLLAGEEMPASRSRGPDSEQSKPQ